VNGILMVIQPARHLILLLTLVILGLMGCSGSKIKTLTLVEKAKQVLIDQKTNNFDIKQIAIKINSVVPEKAVIDKQMDIGIELVTDVALPELKIAYEVSDGLKFTDKWLIFSQMSVTRKLKDIKPDHLYKQVISVIPQNEGLLFLNVYLIYTRNDAIIVKKSSITLSIGDNMSKKSRTILN